MWPVKINPRRNKQRDLKYTIILKCFEILPPLKYPSSDRFTDKFDKTFKKKKSKAFGPESQFVL